MFNIGKPGTSVRNRAARPCVFNFLDTFQFSRSHLYFYFYSNFCMGLFPLGVFCGNETGAASLVETLVVERLTTRQRTGQTPPPTPTVQTVTVGGTVMTVTVTPTSGVTSPNQANITSSSGGLGVGASVGIAIGVISAAVLAGVAGFCVWRRKKQREDEKHGAFQTPSPRGSSAGMTSSPKATEAGMTPPFLARHPDGTYESDNSGRRRSFLMPIDPRIDPTHTAIYNRDGNKSHESVNTLRDDQDYSRRVHQPTKVLRATNPDPDDD